MKTIATILLGCALAAPVSAQVIVGFTASRGGSYNLQSQAAQRGAISAALPNATFSFTSTLSTSSLAGASGVLIASPFDNANPISALTSSEQAALLALVMGGGFAIILADSSFNTPFNTTNDSFTAPFALGVDNNNTGEITIVSPAANAISNGPFGLVTTLPGIAGGEIVSLPSQFVTLGQYPSGAVAAGYIPAGALAPGSGPVLFIGDANVFNENIGGNPNSYKLLSNFVAVAAIPEPGTWSLMLAGLAVIAAAWRRRAGYGRS